MKVPFRKSTLSSGGDNCVEVGVADSGEVLVRHSRDGVHALTFTQGEWAAFVGGVKAGQFDHA